MALRPVAAYALVFKITEKAVGPLKGNTGSDISHILENYLCH